MYQREFFFFGSFFLFASEQKEKMNKKIFLTSASQNKQRKKYFCFLILHVPCCNERNVGVETPVPTGIFNFRKNERLRLTVTCPVSRFVGVETPTCGDYGLSSDRRILKLKTACCRDKIRGYLVRKDISASFFLPPNRVILEGLLPSCRVLQQSRLFSERKGLLRCERTRLRRNRF